mgnify:CR=1 FL=1
MIGRTYEEQESHRIRSGAEPFTVHEDTRFARGGLDRAQGAQLSHANLPVIELNPQPASHFAPERSRQTGWPAHPLMADLGAGILVYGNSGIFQSSASHRVS